MAKERKSDYPLKIFLIQYHTYVPIASACGIMVIIYSLILITYMYHRFWADLNYTLPAPCISISAIDMPKPEE